MQQFLDWFKGNHVFVAIPESQELKGSTDSHWPVTLSGKFEDVRGRLLDLNAQGYGVFFTVNHSATGARQSADIDKVRALFVELDCGTMDDEEYSSFISMYKPSIMVQSSPGNAHVYWLVENVDRDMFGKLQMLLQYKFKEYDAGIQSKDLPRLLRIPGFLHNKKEPVEVRLLYPDNSPRMYEDVATLFGTLNITEEFVDEAKASKYFTTSSFDKSKNNPAIVDDGYKGISCGGRNDAMFNYCYENLFRRKGLNKEEALQVCLAANEKNSPPLEVRDVHTLVLSAHNRFMNVHEGSSVSSERAQATALLEHTDLEHIGDRAFKYKYNLPEMFPPHAQSSVVSRVIQRFGHLIRYNNYRGFYVKESNVWKNDGRSAALLVNLINRVTVELPLEEEFTSQFVNDNGMYSNRAMLSCLKDCHSVRYIEQIKLGLQNHLQSYMHPNEFEADKDKHKIACSNGIVDLLKGTLIPEHEYNETHLVAQLPFAFDHEATCPTWEAFIKSCMNNDEELVEYVQKISGYLISGFTHLNSIFIVYGVPGTGKSRYLNILGKMLGDYARELSPTTMVDNSGNAATLSSLAQAQYARMVTVLEVDEKDVWNKSLIKALSGEDLITAKKFFQDPYEFKPRFKMCIRANTMPTSTSLDTAMWDRVKFVPFMVRFRGTDKEDKGLEGKLMAEIPGIFNWCQRGLVKLTQERDITLPTYVKTLYEDIKYEVEPFLGFYDRYLSETIGNDGLTAVELYGLFRRYCEENKIKLGEIARMTTILKDKGYSVSRNHKYPIECSYIPEPTNPLALA